MLYGVTFCLIFKNDWIDLCTFEDHKQQEVDRGAPSWRPEVRLKMKLIQITVMLSRHSAERHLSKDETSKRTYIHTLDSCSESDENQMEEIKMKIKLNRDVFGKIKGSMESHPSLRYRKSTPLKWQNITCLRDTILCQQNENTFSHSPSLHSVHESGENTVWFLCGEQKHGAGIENQVTVWRVLLVLWCLGGSSLNCLIFHLHEKTDVNWLLSLLSLAHWRSSSTGEHLSSQLQFLIQTRSSLPLLPVACYKYFSSYPWAFFFSLFKATSLSCL